MKLLICIDDTDNLESRGTGELAELIAICIEEKGWGKCSVITRHQLLLHDAIPYTSHNSAMCFEMTGSSGIDTEKVIAFAGDFLKTESADGSDPGLAVADVDALPDHEAVIEFGRRAKREVLTKQQAYAFAEKHVIHLSEHGGTGQGVIGALAGIGLRLSGNDGRIKGKLQLGTAGDSLSVKELLTHPQVDAVEDIDGAILSPETAVVLGEKVKTVWLDHRTVLLVSRTDETWQTCGQQQLRKF